jgi:hypothetical protein
MPTDSNQSPVPDALVSPRAAATLTGLELSRVRELIRACALRVERIRGAEFVSLAEVERAAAREAGNGQ